MRLAGKTAIITGAGSGMGKAMAERFADEGARILCADISGAQDEVARAIGRGAIGLHVDVAEEADIRNMVSTAEEAFGRVDILVNNAGFGGGAIVNIGSAAGMVGWKGHGVYGARRRASAS